MIVLSLSSDDAPRRYVINEAYCFSSRGLVAGIRFYLQRLNPAQRSGSWRSGLQNLIYCTKKAAWKNIFSDYLLRVCSENLIKQDENNTNQNGINLDKAGPSIATELNVIQHCWQVLKENSIIRILYINYKHKILQFVS